MLLKMNASKIHLIIRTNFAIWNNDFRIYFLSIALSVVLERTAS